VRILLSVFIISIVTSAYAQSFVNALSFNSSGDFVKVDYDFPTTYIYNEMWFKADSIPTQSLISVSAFGFGTPETRDAHYKLSIDADSHLEFRVRATTPTTKFISITGTTVVQPGSWYHVYAAFSNLDKFEIWLDGKLEASDNNHIYGDLGKITTVPPLLTIATLFEDGDTANTFYGSIDEVRIWDVYRDSNQRNTTMYDTLGNAYYLSADSGLAAYWRFDEFEDLGINGDGVDDLRDLTIWNRHGDLNGSATLVPSVIVGVDDNEIFSPSAYSLSTNYPNPFNPTTIISYQIPEFSFVTLKVYGVLGNEIATLVNEEKPAGRYDVEFDATALTSGIYFYRIQASSFVETKKMVLMK